VVRKIVYRDAIQPYEIFRHVSVYLLRLLLLRSKISNIILKSQFARVLVVLISLSHNHVSLGFFSYREFAMH